eukprot:8506052-Pyramimonas_sp.AAC.1
MRNSAKEVTAGVLLQQLLYRLRKAKKRRSTTKWSVPAEIASTSLGPTYLSKSLATQGGVGY